MTVYYTSKEYARSQVERAFLGASQYAHVPADILHQEVDDPKHWRKREVRGDGFFGHWAQVYCDLRSMQVHINRKFQPLCVLCVTPFEPWFTNSGNDWAVSWFDNAFANWLSPNGGTGELNCDICKACAEVVPTRDGKPCEGSTLNPILVDLLKGQRTSCKAFRKRLQGAAGVPLRFNPRHHSFDNFYYMSPGTIEIDDVNEPDEWKFVQCRACNGEPTRIDRVYSIDDWWGDGWPYHVCGDCFALWQQHKQFVDEEYDKIKTASHPSNWAPCG